MGSDARWHRGLYEDAYHSDHSRLSSSALKLALADPFGFGKWCAGEKVMEPTEDMVLGTYVHALLLDSAEERARRFAYYPSRAEATQEVLALGQVGPRGGKPKMEPTGERRPQDDSPGAEFRSMLLKGKGIRGEDVARQLAAFNERAKGRTVITPEQQRVAQSMAQAFRAHPKARALLESPTADTEVSGYWTDAETGLSMRCRPDILDTTRRYIGSIKTGGFVAPGPRLTRHHIGLGTLRQMAIEWDAYTAIEGHPPKIYVFIHVANKPDRHGRYLVSVQPIMSDDDLAHPALLLGREGDGQWREGMEPGIIIEGAEDRIIGYREALLIADSRRTERDFVHSWERETVPYALPSSIEATMAYHHGARSAVSREDYEPAPEILGATPAESYNG